MAEYKLLLPAMGESVDEATITQWLKNEGDSIEADDAVVEIATDKVDSEVPSEISGKLLKKLVDENQVVRVGGPLQSSKQKKNLQKKRPKKARLKSLNPPRSNQTSWKARQKKYSYRQTQQYQPQAETPIFLH